MDVLTVSSVFQMTYKLLCCYCDAHVSSNIYDGYIYFSASNAELDLLKHQIPCDQYNRLRKAIMYCPLDKKWNFPRGMIRVRKVLNLLRRKKQR